VGARQAAHREACDVAYGREDCRIDGRARALGIDIAAYEHRDRPIVLDDVDGLYADRRGIRLMKTLCQTDPVKSLSWQTCASALDRLGIPRQFTTTSRVAVIANAWKSLNADVSALEDRGHVLHFVPSAVEVHREAGRWFWDQEVFDFVADHLHLVERPSLRVYPLAWELKAAGMDWKAGVLSRCLAGTAYDVARLKADPAFASEEDRVRAFVAGGLGCRATYFNHARRLSPAEPAPRIPLANERPPQPPPLAPFDLNALLQQRFKRLGSG
jgi:hypothetical protein